MTELRITRPDDWHVHLRDGDMLRAVLPWTARLFGRAMAMPNLVPPVRTEADAVRYRERMAACLPPGHPFRPVLACYLTDDTDPAEVRRGFASGAFGAVKLFPAGATTNSQFGVTDLSRARRVLEAMEEAGIPLLVHGETADPDVDVFDREAVFVDRTLSPLRRDFPGLRLVLEHVTSRRGVEFVLASGNNLAATITPHHLLLTRSDLFRGGLNPHLHCLPPAKTAADRAAVRRAAISGDPRFFLGTDSAPHPVSRKESACAPGGVFCAPTALEYAAQVFEEEGALHRLEAFASLNGARFYGLPPNPDTVVLRRRDAPAAPLGDLRAGSEAVRPFQPAPLRWEIIEGLRPV